MLTWTQRPDGWYANGFRIQLDRPHRWLLLEGSQTASSVSVSEQPLAVARTLTECKREAELVSAARRRSAVQRRHLATLLFAVAGAIVLVGSSPAITGFVIAVSGFLVTRSAIVLLGTLLPRALGEQHEVFYQ